MRRFLAFCLIFVLLLAGCSGKQEQKWDSRYEQEREGIWQSEDGSYVCIFPNGCALYFDDAELREGTWLEDTQTIVAEFTSGAEKGEQWEYSVKESSVRYEYDAGSGNLLADGKEKYAPVVTEEAFRAAAEHIDLYEEAGDRAWMSQVEMNTGTGTVSELWDGLEAQLFAYLKQTAEDPEALQLEEDAWVAERLEEVSAAYEEYAGGSIAVLVAASESSRITKEHIEDLLVKLP